MSHRPCRVAATALFVALGWGLAASSARAQIVTIDGNKASATIGVGAVSVDVAVEFEQVTGLTASSLGLSARAVSPAELIGRLPDVALTSLPLSFPVLVSIEPPTTGGLSFSGLASVSLHTEALSYVPNTPLRLFKASIGGPFVDVTETMGMGSYRARGSSGGFSQFLIIVDLRPTAVVVNQKLDQLDALVTANAASIPTATLAQLRSQLASARTHWNASDEAAAMADVDAFSATVKSAADAGTIPNVWRAARDLVDVGGKLRAAAGTLRFSLSIAG
jgi:hypothetical protein